VRCNRIATRARESSVHEGRLVRGIESRRRCRLLDSGIASVDLDALEIAGGPGVAYEVGRYAIRLESDGEEAKRGTYLLVHERQRDGTWLRAVDVFNPDSSHD
jgi:hypothetical protein